MHNKRAAALGEKTGNCPGRGRSSAKHKSPSVSATFALRQPAFGCFPVFFSRQETKKEKPAMNEDTLNTSVRKFLKEVGVTSQREIEKAVRDGVESGKLKGNEKLPAKMTLTVGGVNLSWTVDGDIRLE
jgi:hypothetical protein